MRRRHPRIPRVWLMTDERLGEALWAALDRLPLGGGVVFRHYGTRPADRRRLFDQVRRVARRRGLVLVLAGSPAQARAWGAAGAHARGGARGYRGQLRTAPVHDLRELAAARRSGVDAMMISPVFATRSHANAQPLGPLGFARLARLAGRAAAIALGGMDRRRGRGLRAVGAYGWAAIDAWASVRTRGPR